MKIIKSLIVMTAIVGSLSFAAAAQNFDAEFSRGMEQHKNKDFTACAASFARSISYDATRYAAHYNLGLCKIGLKQYAEANTALRKALQLKPDFVEAMIQLGNSLDLSGDYKGALVSYENAKRLEPNNESIYYEMGVAHEGQKKYALAEASYRKAVDLSPNYLSALMALGMSLDKQKKYDDGFIFYERAAKLEPKNIKANRRVGDYFVRIGTVSRSDRRL